MNINIILYAVDYANVETLYYNSPNEKRNSPNPKILILIKICAFKTYDYIQNKFFINEKSP